MNADARIVLERRGNLWHWEMTAKGEQHTGTKGEPTAASAAEKAETMRRAIDLSRHFQRERAKASH
jgi:hypothetical protein